MSLFTAAEIARRWAQVRKHLNDVECVVVPSFHNSYYLSGFPMVQGGRWAITVLFRDYDPVLIVPAFEAGGAAAHSPIRDVRLYRDDDGPSFLQTAAEHAIAALRQRECRVIGIEGRGMPAALYFHLSAAFPDAVIRDVTDIIDDVRIVSAPEEIIYLREASRVVDAGMKSILDQIGPGSNESLLCADAQLVMARTVANGMQARTTCYLQQGERSSECHAGATNAPIEPGQMVEIVCEAEVCHYQCAVERCVLIGDVPERVERAYTTMLQAFSAAKDSVRPGATFAEVDAAARTILLGAGYDQITTGSGLVRNILHPWGGRIEFGNLRPHNDRRLARGMVLSVEPWALVPGVGGPRNCDMVLVTETGHEVLSQVESGILRVPAAIETRVTSHS